MRTLTAFICGALAVLRLVLDTSSSSEVGVNVLVTLRLRKARLRALYGTGQACLELASKDSSR